MGVDLKQGDLLLFVGSNELGKFSLVVFNLADLLDELTSEGVNEGDHLFTAPE